MERRRGAFDRDPNVLGRELPEQLLDAVLPLDGLHLSRSLRRTLVSGRFSRIGLYTTTILNLANNRKRTVVTLVEPLPSTSIGDIAVAPSNPDIVWVGTGEANLFRASLAGVGIGRSPKSPRRVRPGACCRR